ncbi:hypothetical protein [Pseudomonas viridiflava]|uniref:hypothetical protein n=1 Tax=Pseudomonas viridiflava TaxID=33069 RepID=UPI000C07B529|nr:hypothetical protein [Pseudomonas viridiflava]PHN61974.1 hypothetical protein AO275_20810 [Pseudomonas viridiflava]
MSEIKERPILFSAPMVRAILEGRKTVTRRAIKNQPKSKSDIGSYGPGQPFIRNPDVTKPNPECPYGRPGDRLWVREAWQADAQVDSVAPRDLSQGEPILYPADGASRQTGCSMIAPGKTRPSIHMPRCVSRILLEITNVRVERLQDITQEQAKAEGVRLYADHADLGDWWHVEGIETYSADPRKSFELLWTSVGGDWNANPWVWAVEFKQVKQ